MRATRIWEASWSDAIANQSSGVKGQSRGSSTPDGKTTSTSGRINHPCKADGRINHPCEAEGRINHPCEADGRINDPRAGEELARERVEPPVELLDRALGRLVASG